jgi:hypothetical protein
MFGRIRRLRADLAEERRLHGIARRRLAAMTTECASWKRRSQVTSGDHAALVIERTRQRDEAVRAQETAEAELARIRNGGLYRQIRAAANAEVANGYGRAVRDFARGLEAWLPEDTRLSQDIHAGEVAQ